MSILDIRKKIDEIDDSIVDLFIERMKLVEDIGKLKIEYGVEAVDVRREREILDKVKQRAEDEGISPASVEKLFMLIIQMGRARQGDLYFASAIHNQSSVLVINGPNLNIIGEGFSESSWYETYADLLGQLERRSEELQIDTIVFQSNLEGDIIDCIQAAKGVFSGVIINPGAYAYTSYAIAQALDFLSIPKIEVHLDMPPAEEGFGSGSIISKSCDMSIIGRGIAGYIEALEALKKLM